MISWGVKLSSEQPGVERSLAGVPNSTGLFPTILRALIGASENYNILYYLMTNINFILTSKTLAY